MVELNSQIDQLNRIAKALAPKLMKLKIETVSDLIFYYPFRYDDFTNFTTIDKLEPGTVATVEVVVETVVSKKTYRRQRSITEAVVSDETGTIKVIWFNQPWISKNIGAGSEIRLSGKVTGDLFDLCFNSPSYERVGQEETHTAGLVPVYSVTAGVSQKQLRFLIKSALHFVNQVEDFLPDTIAQKQNLWPLTQALEYIHFPRDKDNLKLAKKRLAFDEIFLLQLWSQLNKKELDKEQAAKISFHQEQTKSFVAGLGFDLTSDQKKSAWAIIQDMAQGRPMNRLLEGDVGSGKTLVAILAMYNVFLSGHQSAFMAPTEILAQQHYLTIQKVLPEDELRVGLLTRTQAVVSNHKISKAEFLSQVSDGSIDVVVGTHALIQAKVEFKNLALVVVDEQHRFGVKQRQALKQKSDLIPHFLSLTATPIPRSLALTLYGDLDLSVIKEMPAGRKKIITKIVSPQKRQLAYDFIAKEIESGRQVFVICPLVDVSDKLGVKSVVAEYKKLNENIFPDINIGSLHGKMKAEEKEQAIKDFKAGQSKILVATSVVEVGIDVPNASVIMIEDAERFGLAQLHQFRGRVGRSVYQSYCFVFTQMDDEKTIDRLHTLVEFSDGFSLAQKDLEYRGAGAVYGYEQSGFSRLFKIADLSNLGQVKKIKKIAEDFISHQDIKNYPLLNQKVKELGLVDHRE